jgi:adenosylcobinamide kinase / adenosylcobinamide-phosphate guanylyltransferase
MITLVLGGTRSGKSEWAEQLAGRGAAPVTYVATAAVEDPGFRARVEAHRARRPATWTTVETGEDLAATVRRLPGTVVVDSLGAWIAGSLDDEPDVDDLCDALAGRAGTTIVVSEEVGLGVHPATAVGLRFADVLGDCNCRVAAVADRVVLVIAGRALDLSDLPRPDRNP